MRKVIYWIRFYSRKSQELVPRYLSNKKIHYYFSLNIYYYWIIGSEIFKPVHTVPGFYIFIISLASIYPQFTEIQVLSCLFKIRLKHNVHFCPYLSILFHSCPFLSILVYSCLFLSSLVQSCPVLSSLVQSCPALSRLVQSPFLHGLIDWTCFSLVFQFLSIMTD